MSEYNAILELGMQNGLHFPLFLHVLFSTFLYCQCGKLGPYSVFGDFSIHDCPCTCNALSACVILTPARISLAIPTHGDDSCDFSCSVARVKVLLT